MRTQSILFHLIIFLLLSSLTLPAIACPPPDCDDCETWNTETETCDWDCSTGRCCDGGSCVDDCSTGRCCDGSCCDSGNCCNSTKCCPNSDDVCCTDSGSYCCDSGETCCQGSCCTTDQCCDDGTCVDDCPTGECCDDGTCVSSCPTGECCDDGTCVSSCPSGQCCDDGTCVSSCPTGECCDEGNCEPMEMDSVTSNKASACVGCDITFTATTDPTGYEDDVEWSDGGEPATGSGATFTTHWDISGPKTVTAELCDSNESKQVTVVKVGKVVKSGTTDEGPLAPGCPGTSVSLEAKPYPEESSFPTGEPHWTVEGPTGSSPSLSDDTGTTTTLSGTDKLGDYYVTAKCGESDTGDSINVAFNLADDPPYSAYSPTWGEIPGSCDLPCDGEDSYELDDCGNELEFSCCDSGGGGGVLCADRVFYNNSLLSSCVFKIEPENEVYRKKATIDGTELKFITKIKHINVCTQKYLGSCWGYYCTKFYEYDCITGEESTIWRRDPDDKPNVETDGEPCPGH